MIKIFQISSEVNTGSVGKIAEQIGEAVLAHGWESYIAYGRENLPSKSNVIKIGNKLDLLRHGLYTRLTDKHGFGSKDATEKLISKIKEIQPDLIQLQHMHGYFINIELLFNFLAESNIPVVWTFHDCWSFTGHCAYYDMVNCQKWMEHCQNCPQIKEYPKSFVDNSFENYDKKRELFNSLPNLTIVPVSNWLGEETKKSFLKSHKIHVIHNGIDLRIFTPQNDINKLKEKYGLVNKFILLGVANPWSERKGLKYFKKLADKLSEEKQIILIGLTQKQIKSLPENIIGLERTKNAQELAEYYSLADVFVNPTLEEALGMTNIEAIACGTPVITFSSGGAPETIDENTGIVVQKGNIEKLNNAINEIQIRTKSHFSNNCIERAHNLFNKEDNFNKYIDLYTKILKEN